MRRPMFLLGALALLLTGSFSLADKAWSHDKDHHKDCPYGDKSVRWERITFQGTICHVTSPTTMEVQRVDGPGNIVIEADGNPQWNPSEWRTTCSTVLSGCPNGWGGYETAVYTLHTSDRFTVAWVEFEQ